MSQVTQAEQYLLDQIRLGTTDAWSQLVERYEGRLLAFAQARLPQRADAEDVAQDTFVAFLKSINQFQGQSTLETYLFAILRRKIIDTYRRKEVAAVGLIQDMFTTDPKDETPDAMQKFAAPNATASWYVSRDEQQHLQEKTLTAALEQLLSQFKKSLNFRDLQIIELLFYCRLTNKQIADTLNLRENHIALIKHRFLKQLHDLLAPPSTAADTLPTTSENILRDIWQQQRLSCLKRSTIGSYLLETLDADWLNYVDFHLNILGCHVCRANLADLRQQNNASAQQKSFRRRIFESTVGFLHQ